MCVSVCVCVCQVVCKNNRVDEFSETTTGKRYGSRKLGYPVCFARSCEWCGNDPLRWQHRHRTSLRVCFSSCCFFPLLFSFFIIMDCFLFLDCRVGRRKRQANYEETYPHTVSVDRGPWFAFFCPSHSTEASGYDWEGFYYSQLCGYFCGPNAKEPPNGTWHGSTVGHGSGGPKPGTERRSRLIAFSKWQWRSGNRNENGTALDRECHNLSGRILA